MSGDIRLHFVGVAVFLSIAYAASLASSHDAEQRRDLTRLEQRITQLETPRAVPSRADRTRPQASAVGRREAPRPKPRGEGLNWTALFLCESGNNPRAISASGKYRGLAQFDLATWRSVGGTGDPINATRAEQTRRAQQLYDQRGAQPWPQCGRYLR